MSAINRVFLGWDDALVNKVRDYLLNAVTTDVGKAPDLQGNLIVVPTRQAGRRLRESLALWCNNNNTALLSAQIVTPNYLFSCGLGSAIAGDVITLSIWVQVLMEADLAQLASLFPSLNSERNFQWALNTGEIIQRLRDELSDGAYSINGVVEQYASELEELDRWQDLALLEELYLKEIEKLGKQDRCLAKISAAESVKLDPAIKKITIAGVPDPSLLALKALDNIVGSGVDVEILIHAEQDMDNAFDKWGRPKADYWKNVDIDIADWNKDVLLEAKPVDQARRVLEEIGRNQKTFEPGEIAIGVPDRSVIPFLQKVMDPEGIPPFDPADKMAGDHPTGRLAACVLGLLQESSYQSVADMLRHPDFLGHLKADHELESEKVLTQLDEFQNYYLPVNLSSMLAKFKDDPNEEYIDLGKALAVTQSLLDIFGKNSFEEAWRSFYKQIYNQRILQPRIIRDAEFENAALAIDDVLREFRELTVGPVPSPGATRHFSVVELSSLFVRRLLGATYHCERRDEVIDLEGWLELPWNDRPFLMVTGMNEEFVPGGSLSDVFLPDSLRRIIDLRDDSSRFARDVFLMQSMIKSRASSGNVCFIVGKTAISGDPLKPSRLFFRCEDSELPMRVEKLLAEAESTRSRSWPQLIFPLEPAKAERKEGSRGGKYISVTSFKDYLACPFRYYLGHMLGMEESDDAKVGLDHMDFGIIVHEALQEMGMDKELWASTNATVLGDRLAELAVEQVVKRFGNPPSPYVLISLASAQERLRAAARAQVRLVEEGWEIIDVETGQGKSGAEKDRWRLRRNGFTISGRIDRIDRNSIDGRIRIIDYKTFDNERTTPESEHLLKRKDDTPDYNDFVITKELKSGTKTTQKCWQDLQLPLYAMIYSQGTEYKEDIELAYFILPKVISKTGITSWGEFNEARHKSAVRCLDGVLSAIDNQVFWPPSENIKYDNFENMFHFESSVKELK